MALAPTSSHGTAAAGELVAAQVTANVTVSSVTEATPDTVITLGAFTYSAVPTIIEFSCASVNPAGGTILGIILELWDAAAYLARVVDSRFNPSPVDAELPLNFAYRLTPSAGSHTYLVRGFKVGGGGNVTLNAGNGTGGSGTYTPIQMWARLA